MTSKLLSMVMKSWPSFMERYGGESERDGNDWKRVGSGHGPPYRWVTR